MARKFKIGNIVKVVKRGNNSIPFEKGFKIGSKGKVINYNKKFYPFYPYQVENLNSKKISRFTSKELELIERK